MDNRNIDEYTIKDFLTRHGLDYIERGDEIMFPCPFNSCDDDDGPYEKISL